MSAKGKMVALIDIGSNSIHTCVYLLDGKQKSFKKVFHAHDFAGLASYVDDDSVMSRQGISVGAKAVAKMVRMTRMVGCDQIYAFATAAVRNCVNSQEVIDAIKRSSGCKVRILSGKEEARLSMLGALKTVSVKSGLFFDLGGGSTELSILDGGKMLEWDSIPVGSLSSWRNSAAGVISSPAELEAIAQGFKEMLRTSPVSFEQCYNVCGIGGTMRLALKLICSLDGESRPGRRIFLSDLDRILEMGQTNPDELTRAILRIKPARIHTLLPGCAIAREILKESQCSSIEVAKTGLREGFLMKEVMKK